MWETMTKNPISGNQWVKHCTQLFHERNISPSDKPISEELKMQNEFNELSYSRAYDKIGNAIIELKKGKAAGPDRLISENIILKASASLKTPFLYKLFNKMQTTGEYPKIWAEDTITSIHTRERGLIRKTTDDINFQFHRESV